MRALAQAQVQVQAMMASRHVAARIDDEDNEAAIDDGWCVKHATMDGEAALEPKLRR
jgi:hypothetical protein